MENPHEGDKEIAICRGEIQFSKLSNVLKLLLPLSQILCCHQIIQFNRISCNPPRLVQPQRRLKESEEIFIFVFFFIDNDNKQLFYDHGIAADEGWEDWEGERMHKFLSNKKRFSFSGSSLFTLTSEIYCFNIFLYTIGGSFCVISNIWRFFHISTWFSDSSSFAFFH